MLWMFLLEIPTGAVADYFGRKQSISLGSLCIAAGALIYGSVPQFGMFLFAEFLWALGNALLSGADRALLYDTLRQHSQAHTSTAFFGKAHSFELFGMMTGALLGGSLAQYFGLNAPMLLSAASFMLSGLFGWLLPEPPRDQSVSESKQYLDVVKTGIHFIIKSKPLRLMTLNAIIVASAAYFVIWLYQPLLQRLGVPIAYFGVIHAIFVGAEILIASNFSRLERWARSPKNLLAIMAVIPALAFFAAGAKPSLITAGLLIVFAGGLGLTRIEYISALMNKMIPSAERATVLSSLSMFRRFALVLLNPLVGFTADHSLTLALIGVGILPLLVFLIPYQDNGGTPESV
jgi:MFS family permease